MLGTTVEVGLTPKSRHTAGVSTAALERVVLLGNVAEIQNFLRITKINLLSNLAPRGRGVHLHSIVDRDAEALQERGRGSRTRSDFRSRLIPI